MVLIIKVIGLGALIITAIGATITGIPIMVGLVVSAIITIRARIKAATVRDLLMTPTQTKTVGFVVKRVTFLLIVPIRPNSRENRRARARGRCVRAG